MASRSTNTMVEALQKLNRDIADMKTLPDADRAWLVQLENMILERMTRPVQELQAQGQLPQSPQPAGTPMGGGNMAGVQPPNADELSRLMSGMAGAQ